MKQFIVDFIAQFTLSSTYTQVGLFVCSDYMALETPLGTFTQEGLVQVLDYIDQDASTQVILNTYVYRFELQNISNLQLSSINLLKLFNATILLSSICKTFDLICHIERVI